MKQKIAGLYDEVLNFIYHRVSYNKEIAEDICHDVFEKALKKQDIYTENGSLKYWLFRIAQNTVIDYHRKSNRIDTYIKRTPIDDMTLEDESTSYKHWDIFKDTVVEEAISSLSEERRELINLFYYRKIPFKDIAEMQGVTIGSVLGKMRYAKIELKKILKDKV